MAKISKHRRGSVTQLKDVTARIGELVMATGSIGDLNGPFLFLGETEGAAGAYRPTSKIYQGSAAPTLSVGSHGSVLDGTPFYASGNQSLYVLSKDGNSRLDLTGNIEGNLISGVTINNLTGTTANLSNNGGTALMITGDIVQTGSFYTSGDIVLRGNINIGDNLTGDTVTLNSEISSSLIPDSNNNFDLGSSEKYWRNLYVSGTAYVDTLQANQVNFSDLGILQDLSVSGSTYLGNGGDVTVVSGSLYNDQLTQKRLVVVGADGLLTDYSGLTFDNGNLNLSGALEVTNIQGTGSLYLKPDLNDGRDFRIYNTAPSDIHIKGNASYNFFGDDTNYLKIDDSAATVTIDSTNGLFVGTTLQAQDTTELQGAVTMNSTLDVTGSAQFKSTIDVDSEATLASAIVEDLTQDRIVTVGASGALIDSSGFTYNGSVFKIGGGNFEVDSNDGDVRTSGSLTVEGGQTINGDVTVNGILTVTGNTQLGGNLYVSGNLEVLGSSTEVHIQSQTIELDDNIIRLNAYSPFERYAGFEVMDSGSSGVSASMVWDSLNDYWLFVSASGQSSKFVGTTPGTYGSEVSLTTNTIPKATGANNIGDSLLVDNGTTLSYNTNKFIITGSTGEALIYGNVTLSSAGGADAGTKTSAIVFRNSSNVLGYVSTTVSTQVTDGLLGYKVSDGSLVFSDLIDGGSY